MERIERPKFQALSVNGDNYQTWTMRIENHLAALKLKDTITDDFDSTKDEQRTFQSLIFIQQHISDELMIQYSSIKNPAQLWAELKQRFDNIAVVLRPKTLHEWNHLRFMDFASVNEYCNALYTLVDRMKTCGLQDMVTDNALIDKTLQTFHPANSTLMATYYSRKFTAFADLLQALLLAEQQLEVLQSNYDRHPKPLIHSTASQPSIYATVARGSTSPRPARRGPQRDYLRTNVTCYGCGEKGHYQNKCPNPYPTFKGVSRGQQSNKRLRGEHAGRHGEVEHRRQAGRTGAATYATNIMELPDIIDNDGEVVNRNF